MEEFVLQLLQEQGVPQDLDPEVKAQLVAEMTARASDFLNRRMIDAMSDDAVEQFNTMLDDDSLDAARLQDYVAANVPNKDQVVVDALREFRALYLGDKA